MKRKLKSIITAALCAVGLAAAAGLVPVEYLDWDDVGKEMTNAVCTAYTGVAADTATFEAGKTYVVQGDVTVSSRITVNGTVAEPTRLILCDGAKLTASAGVKVTVSGATTNALVICGQVNGTGALEATGGLNMAGIGGLENGTGGTVTINGGTVTATGGLCAAGIGGSWGGHGGTVTINGGTVTATGGTEGAGIGGGLYGAGGTVTINGGTVTATAGTDGEEAPTVAIGCCQESGDNGTVTFGAGNWLILAGNAAPGDDMTAEAYAADHSAKYVHIESAAPEISAVSAEGFLDLTVGDRIAADEEPLVVDPAWGNDASEAQVQIDGEANPRDYTGVTIDTWDTTDLEPGRYAMSLTAGEIAGEDAYTAAFWKLGADWVVFDSSNVTANVTFEADKTYLVLGTNTVDATLTVRDGAKFFYGEGVPSGFKGGTPTMSKRYKQEVDGDLYQIVEVIKGCEDNPWDVGEGVTAYTNGNELVIGGNGTIADLSEIPTDVKGGITAINVASNGVAGVASDAFQGVGDGEISLTLPDGWQGELPDNESGNWYGATGVTLTAYPLAVKNVTFLQRYPWNGKVDVGFTLTGPEGETNVVVTVRDGANKVANFTAAVVIPTDGVLETSLVWDAAAAGLAANFKSDDVTVEVAFAGGLPAGQLWKDGPIWAECNVGDGATVPGDFGALYTFEGDKAKAAAEGLGDGWRLPSYGELDKLDECTKSWETCKDSTGADRWGYRFTGTGDYSSNSIFLPAAGYSSGDGRENAGSYGYYWSSEVGGDGDAWHLYFWDEQVCMNDSYVDCGMPVRAVRNAPAASSASAISAKSAAGTVDLRPSVTLAEGAVTVAGVSYSDTAWGAADAADVTLGYTNLTTGATDSLASGLTGAGAAAVDLPQKDGDYVLTHSTGELKSFVTFVVSGYPLGCETNPWELGDGVEAWMDGETLLATPARGTANVDALVAVTNALGQVPSPFKVISEDGSATNEVVMLLGSDGVVYDTLAEVLAADPMPETVRLFEVNGYSVSYSGGKGALGTMATDTFIPTVPTNLTANAFEIIGYRFDGWTTNGTTVAYTNRAAGVDFVQPGETLSLTALWTQVETKAATYYDLSNMLAKVTRPLRITLDEDVEIPLGGKITVPAGKDVTFIGDGKFDVTAERPALFDGYSVGTGLKPEDLDRFKTDADVKAYYEDGKVVVRGRGETEEFPWLLGTDGHEDEVTAWAIDGGILTKPVRGTASVAALVAVTNALDGYVPDTGELKVISADGTATNDVVMLLGSDGVVYDTLAEVLAADPMPETVRLFEVKGADVEFNAMGGVHANGLEVITNFCIVTYTLPEAPVRTDYEFLGWYDGWTNNARVVTNDMDLLCYEPHTLYAKWESLAYPTNDVEAEVVGGEAVIEGAEKSQKVADAKGVIALPDVVTVDGAEYPCTVIQTNAFLLHSEIKEVATPLYVTNVRARAFYNCQNLNKLRLCQPRDYKTLEKVSLTVGRYAFANLGITDLVIPSGVSKLDAYAFASCANLTNVTILGRLEIEGKYPFRRCGGTNGVTIALSPRAATDGDFIKQLTNGCDRAVISARYAGEIDISGNPRVVGDAVEIDFSYSADDVDVNVDTVAAIYAPSADGISADAELLDPISVVKNADGTYTAVFAKPVGENGCCRLTINIEK